VETAAKITSTSRLIDFAAARSSMLISGPISVTKPQLLTRADEVIE
jgi:hypothetical protein